MSRRTAAWLAGSLCGLSVVLFLCGGFLTILNGMLVADFSLGVVALSSAVIGGVIASRRPANVVGWLFLGTALFGALQEFTRQWAVYGLTTEPGGLPFPWATAWVAVWAGPLASALLFVILPLHFPDGRPVLPRWRPVTRLAVLVLAANLFLDSLLPNTVVYGTGISNPLAVEALRPHVDVLSSLSLAVWLGLIFVAVLSLAVRFWRSRGEERQQLKWFFYAVSIVLVWFSTNWPVAEAFPKLFPVLDTLVISGIPVASGVAILKYRLYDIDVVINRTLVYVSLTATLATLYFGGVATTQALFRALTGQQEQSQLAIVISTLVIAALFSPLRRRIQEFIDRRFYRRKYDAAKTLEAFSAKLRDETDLDRLGGELVGVVRETMQPAHVSLWLRPEADRKGKQVE